MMPYFDYEDSFVLRKDPCLSLWSYLSHVCVVLRLFENLTKKQKVVVKEVNAQVFY